MFASWIIYISVIGIYIALFFSSFSEQFDISEYQDFLNAENSEIGTVYQIQEDSLKKESGEDSVYAQDIWKTFSQSVPQTWRSNIDDLVVIDAPDSYDLIYIKADEEDETMYDLYLNIVAINENIQEGETPEYIILDNLVYTLGVLISLRDDQLEYTKNTDDCELYIPEGCIRENSYLGQFMREFGLSNEGVRDEYGDIIYPELDFAKSFLFYTLYELPENDSPYVSDEKILFFTKFPELTTLSQDILKNIYSGELYDYQYERTYTSEDDEYTSEDEYFFDFDEE